MEFFAAIFGLVTGMVIMYIWNRYEERSYNMWLHTQDFSSCCDGDCDKDAYDNRLDK